MFAFVRLVYYIFCLVCLCQLCLLDIFFGSKNSFELHITCLSLTYSIASAACFVVYSFDALLHVSLYALLYVSLYALLYVSLYALFYVSLYALLYVSLYALLYVSLYALLHVLLYALLYISCICPHFVCNDIAQVFWACELCMVYKQQ